MHHFLTHSSKLFKNGETKTLESILLMWLGLDEKKASYFHFFNMTESAFGHPCGCRQQDTPFWVHGFWQKENGLQFHALFHSNALKHFMVKLHGTMLTHIKVRLGLPNIKFQILAKSLSISSVRLRRVELLNLLSLLCSWPAKTSMFFSRKWRSVCAANTLVLQDLW